MRLQMFRACSTLSKGKPFYITTPIFYVNAAPHIGHLYSALIADARFRFESLINNTSNQVFSTGTDEHGLKIQQAASGKGVAVNEYCERIATEYKKLFNTAKVDFTHFIRTTEKDHETAVHNFWNKLNEGGHIYSSNYSGWYCVSDETFLTDSQLKEVNGKKVSVESGHEVEWAEEKNYIFKLSKYQDDVIHWIKSGNRIRPTVFEKILLDSLAEPLPDVSISRPVSRVDWAVRVPNDDTQSVYVWLDALVNYLTVIGYPNDKFKDMWPADVQVIGKDILKFHGIYWPAFLIAAGLEPPKSLFVHSHWTIEGQKMSKSKFNVIDPTERASTYTFEGLRYFLLREGVAHNDGNYSDVKVLRILNSELADTLGNLMSRCCGKALNPKQLVPEPHHQHLDKLLELDVTKKLQLLLNEVPSKCYDHYYAMNYYLAINEVMAVLHATNNFIEVTKPWELKKGTPDQIELLETILSVAFESLKICGIILQPIIPDISNSLLDKISVPKNERKWCSTDTEMFSKSNIINSRLLGNGPTGLFKRIVLEKKTKASN